MGFPLNVLTSNAIEPGTVLAGKYRVERIIGQGGMGVVVEARHTTLDDRVALKFLLPDYATHPEASKRFLREARAAVRIKSPHVARVSDVGTLENGAPFMVMEYLEGTDAAHAIEQHPLAVGEAIDYVVQAGEALAEAHSLGIVHRDIKPANLFVTRHNDGSPFVKLLDFGISKMATDGGVDALTRTSATMGSALYMSPEQIRQSKSVDHRTDIYALGITLYELLSRQPPFMAESFAALCVEIATGTPTPLASLRPDLPAELVAVVERAFARDAAARFQTVAEFVVALSAWAPARSQPIIERIARSAGLVPRFNSNAPGAPAGQSGFAHYELTGRGTGPGNTSPNVVSAATGASMASAGTVPPAIKRSSLVPILIVGGSLVALAVVAIVAVTVMRARSAASAQSEPVPSVSVAAADLAAPEQPSAAPSAAPTVAPITSEAASAAPTTSEVAAPPKAPTKVVTKSEPKKPEPKKAEPAKTEAPKPPPPANTKSADDYR